MLTSSLDWSLRFGRWSLTIILSVLCGYLFSPFQLHHLQKLDSGAFVDQDLGGPAVDGGFAVHAEVLPGYGAGGNFPEGDQLDFAEHVVFDQHSAERRAFAGD